MQASIAQSGERQTEDLKVPGSIPGRGTSFLTSNIYNGCNFEILITALSKNTCFVLGFNKCVFC